jgi:hypothetical protein
MPRSSDTDNGPLVSHSVWRPLRKVQNWPLALCDSRTLESRCLVAADRVRREFVGEGLWALESPNYRWFYLPEQDIDELTLIKITDSRDDVAKCSSDILSR